MLYVGVTNVDGYVPIAARLEWSGSVQYNATTGINKRTGGGYYASIMCESATIKGNLIVYYIKQSMV